MAQTPDEKVYVEMPFIEQLKGMDWTPNLTHPMEAGINQLLRCWLFS